MNQSESNNGSRSTAPIPHFNRVLHQIILSDAIFNAEYDGNGTSEDPYVITWLPNDPCDPMNIPISIKWTITAIIAMMTLAVSFASSAYSGGIREIQTEFGVSQIVATLGIAFFVLGFAIGPLVWAPLSGQPVRTRLPSCCPLIEYRDLWTPVHHGWFRFSSCCIQCRFSSFSEYDYSSCNAILGWCFRLVAADEWWRCSCGYVSIFPTRTGKHFFFGGSVPWPGDWPHW